MHVIILPLSEESNDKVSLKLLVENLREEVEVRDECSLEDDRNVRSVEQLNGVGLLVALHFSAAHSEFNSESLYSNHVNEYQNNLNFKILGWWVRHLRKIKSRTKLALCECSCEKNGIGYHHTTPPST